MNSPKLDPETEGHIEAIEHLAESLGLRHVQLAAAHMRKLATEVYATKQELDCCGAQLTDRINRAVELGDELDAAQRELRETKAELQAAVKNADSECKLRLQTTAELERLREAVRWAGNERIRFVLRVGSVGGGWCWDASRLSDNSVAHHPSDVSRIEPFGDDPVAALVRLYERNKPR